MTRRQWELSLTKACDGVMESAEKFRDTSYTCTTNAWYVLWIRKTKWSRCLEVAWRVEADYR